LVPNLSTYLTMGNTLAKARDSSSPDLLQLAGTEEEGSSSSSNSSSSGGGGGSDTDWNDAMLDLEHRSVTPESGTSSMTSSSTSACMPLLSLLFGQPARRKESFLFLQDDTDEKSREENEDLLTASAYCNPKSWRVRRKSGSSGTWSFGGECKDYENDENDGTGDVESQRPRLTSANRSQSWIRFSSDLEYTDAEWLLSDTQPTVASDMRRCRPVWIVTTAALPWMTGTAVNPLLRAAYLLKHYRQTAAAKSSGKLHDQKHVSVTLVIPWLESADDRVALYGADWRDAVQQEQDAYIRQWLAESAGLPHAASQLKIEFYPARYHATFRSIFAMGDFCERLCVQEPDAVCILEEPEHVNFYRAPGKTSWRRKFPHVVGIIHTNYKAYASHHATGLLTGPLVGAYSALLVRAYSNKVIKLSPVLQDYAPEKEVVANVHGIRQQFLNLPRPTGVKVYFIGKLLWAKGLDRLLDLQALYKKRTGSYFAMDIYGSGPEEKEIERAYLGSKASADEDGSSDSPTKAAYYAWTPRRRSLPVRFLGRLDHANVPSDCKIFVNASVTEVLCTSSAEALAMGKFVIVPNHPSNVFFQQFPNCLMYQTETEFVALMQYAVAHNPEPLADHLRRTLTWEAATERFLEAATISERDAARRDRVGKQWDENLANAHYELFKGRTGDVFRKAIGAGPVSDQFQYEQVVVSSFT